MLLGLIASLVLFGSLAFVADSVGHRLLPQAPASVRACGTAVVFLALLTLLFSVLAPLGLFRLGMALAAAILLALASTYLVSDWKSYAQGLRAAGSAAGAVLWPASWPVRVFLWLTAGCVAARVLIAMVSPPLAWDSLVYHFTKAGMWVQSGSFHIASWPEAGSYFRYFPPGGDLVWAWAMLPFHADTLLALGPFAVWLVCLLGAYANIGALTRHRTAQLLGACALAFIPACLKSVTSGYVDNLVFALTLLSALFLKRLLESAGLADAALAGAALGLACGVKINALPFFALALAVAAVRLGRRGLRPLLAVAAGGILGSLGYLYALVQTGHLLYPVVAASLSLRFTESGIAPPVSWRLLSRYYLGAGQYDPISLAYFLGVGPVLPLFALPAVAGLWRLGKTSAGRLFALWLVLLMGAAGATVLWPGNRGMLVFWVTTSARFLLPACAGLVLAAAAAPHRWFTPFATLAAGYGALGAVPATCSRAQMAALGDWAPWLLAGGVAAALAAWLVRRFRVATPGLAVAVLSLLLVFLPLGRVRAAYRAQIYGDGTRGLALDMHRMDSRLSAASPIWQELDRDGPLRLAVAAARPAVEAGPPRTQRLSPIHRTWYTYPLLGSRLQNELVFVSALGPSYDEDDPGQATPASGDAWMDRLAKSRSDILVLHSLAPIGTKWTGGFQYAFHETAAGFDRRGLAYEIDQKRLAQLAGLPR
jgi:hypothetical protein